jgi:hypothetical protein
MKIFIVRIMPERVIVGCYSTLEGAIKARVKWEAENPNHKIEIRKQEVW